MRRLLPRLLVLALALAPFPLHAQDEEPDAAEAEAAAADANPYGLSSEEREELEKFRDLERFAITALQARDLEGATRRYRKLVRLLAKDEVLPEKARAPLLQNAHYNLACSLSLSGETTEAIEHFAASLEHGFRGWKHIVKDSDLDPIRAQRDFKQAVEEGKERERDELERQAARLATQLDAGKPLMAGFDFSVETMSGATLTRADLKGKVVVLCYFAPFAGDGASAPEVPLVVRLDRKFRKRGVTVLGLTPRLPGTEKRTDWVQPYVDDQGIGFDVAIVRPGSPAMAPYYRSWHGLRLVLLDANGTVRARCGSITSYDALAGAVERILELTPPSEPAGEKPTGEKPAPADPEKPPPEKPPPERR